MMDTKQTSEQLTERWRDALMSAWVEGWYAGTNRQHTDARKIDTANRLETRYLDITKTLHHAPDLLAACKLFVAAVEKDNPYESVSALTDAIGKAHAAIAAAERIGP